MVCVYVWGLYIYKVKTLKTQHELWLILEIKSEAKLRQHLLLIMMITMQTSCEDTVFM